MGDVSAPWWLLRHAGSGRLATRGDAAGAGGAVTGASKMSPVGIRGGVIGCLVAASLLAALGDPGAPGTSATSRSKRAKAPRATSYPLPLPQAESGPVELEATVIDFPTFATENVYPVFDKNGRRSGTARWRVVTGTGNCCENYLATTPEGRMYDFGSTYLVFSDDEGKTWSQVRPQRTAAAIGGEGSVVLAPNGDVVGVTWIPYGGDRVETFKYDAEANKWFYSYVALHHPFFDRESVAVIPGPIEHLGEEHPYVAVMRGGWPTKNPWYYSFDGLNYVRPNHRALDSESRRPVERWLDVRASKSLDWIQPAIQTTITPLGRGLALAMPDRYRFGSERVDIFDQSDLGWSPFQLPQGELEPGLASKLVVDSTGRLHHVYMTRTKAFYLVSTNGGRTWHEQVIPMPFPGARTWVQGRLDEIYEADPPDPRFEFVANGDLGIMALSVQIHDPERTVDSNYVYRYRLDGARAELQKVYQVGAGDQAFGGDVLATGPRMDFQSIALLPDGRIVVSFGDKSHPQPAVAIEQ